MTIVVEIRVNNASMGSVQVEVYRDRVEVINPGRLHCSMTVADLYKKHESLPPNLRIAHTMYYAKYIEELGTGITELLKKCRKHDLKRPLLEETSGKFRIVLWRRVNKKFGRAESLRFELQVVEYLKSVGENGAKFSDLQQMNTKLLKILPQFDVFTFKLGCREYEHHGPVLHPEETT